MNKKRPNIVFLIIMIVGGLGIFFLSCTKRSTEGMILFTEVAGDLEDIDYITGKSWRYLPGSRIVALNPNESGERPKVLTQDYYSACSPNISFDGNFMIFAGQRKQNDIWQIWEMNLQNLKVRQVTSSKENCIDPVYLPGARLVFSKFISNEVVKLGHALFTCNLDGSEVRQITFDPHTYFASAVLNDGRLLAISRSLYPVHGEAMLMVLRPDGSKQELFYHGAKGSHLQSRGWETDQGKIVFMESDKSDNEGGDIISISYNRPLHSRVNLSSELKGHFFNASPLKTNTLLVSYRSSETDRYGLYEFDTKNKTLGKAIYKDKNHHVVEAIAVQKRERPKKLPSEVDMSVNTGLLLCQDINFLNIESLKDTSSISKATRMEVMGINTSLGIVDVEKDGSFYLKVLADTPFRLQTINANGEVVNGPGSWLYVRPNERRGCVGCHEDNEQVPENRLPLSVKKDPIILPRQIKEIQSNR